MSNEPIDLQHPGMELDNSTFHCPHCDCDIASSNQLTHEVACARLHRNRPTAQPIVRQSSSSATEPSSDVQPRPQPMLRREDRRIVENKLVTCPNCEKSVREQDINSHIDNECLKNEMIPCEFCDQSIPMSDYSQHVEGCQRRAQESRDRSPMRERPGSGMEEELHDVPQQQEPPARDRSPERGSSQGGIRGFFSNLANSASTRIRNYTENLQREAEQREQERQEYERRQRERQEEMLRHMFGQPQVPRNPFTTQNALIPVERPTRVIRTIEQGPGGSIIVRQRVVPVGQPQGFQGMPNQPINMGMNPVELLFGMMGGGMGGMYAIGNGEMMGQPQEETGLDKETINSLALVKYTNEMNKNVDEESKKCPICLDQFEEGQNVRFLWCLHRFHKDCVDPWLEKHTNCPLCKKDFSEAEAGYSP